MLVNLSETPTSSSRCSLSTSVGSGLPHRSLDVQLPPRPDLSFFPGNPPTPLQKLYSSYHLTEDETGYRLTNILEVHFLDLFLWRQPKHISMSEKIQCLLEMLISAGARYAFLILKMLYGLYWQLRTVSYEAPDAVQL